MKTDMQGIRNTCIALFDAVPLEPMDGICGEMGMVSHPFCSSMVFCHPQKEGLLNLSEDDNKKLYREMMVSFINKADLGMLFARVESAYRMTWFKYCSGYMSEEDYAEYLKNAWIEQDNPNQDTNVSRKEAATYFKKANKKLLMNKNDYKYYKGLPSTLTIYRGVSPGREKLGLSWTDDEEKAEWFKERFERGEKEGYMLKAMISKKHVLAYINERDEKELVVDVFSIKNKIKKL